jgi:hypothetical protein
MRARGLTILSPLLVLLRAARNGPLTSSRLSALSGFAEGAFL